MSNISERDGFTSEHSFTQAGSATFPLAGLVPSRLRAEQGHDHGRHLAPKQQGRATRTVLNTMPVLLVGSLALTTLNLTGAQVAPAKRPQTTKADTSDLTSIRKAIAASSARAAESAPPEAPAAILSTAAAPTHYTVKRGDTVSGIAEHYNLSTASVLALNGLSWKSLIFPGQVLKLTKTAAAPTKPVAAKPKPAAPTASASTTKYTIKSGDTVTAIAKKFGVTIQAILTANKLTASSIIYAGRTLVIPVASSGSTSTSTQPAQVGTAITPLSPEMKTNATTIITVGKRLGVPQYGIIIALAAAAQESGLRNLSSGDLDSVGLFQQRPSTGWGTKAQLENTTHASELFFGGPSNPNKGKTRGLLDIKGWQSMTVTQAAQAVQISAHPTAYAKWEASARAWYAAIG